MAKEREEGLPLNVKCGRVTPVHDADTGELVAEIVQEVHAGKQRVKLRHPRGGRFRLGKSSRVAENP